MELSLRDMPFGMGGGCGRAGEPRRHRRRRKLAPGSSTIYHQRVTLACAENDDVLNVFGCGRLVAGIGFLRLPASSTSGVTGVLTYPRKPGGAQVLGCAYASVAL